MIPFFDEEGIIHGSTMIIKGSKGNDGSDKITEYNERVQLINLLQDDLNNQY